MVTGEARRGAGERPATDQIWAWLGAVPDPEIPMVSVVDLGIVRDVAWEDGERGPTCVVTITPTYSGCPATEVIARAIEQTLVGHGLRSIRLERRIAPAWTTDWISEAGRRKLRASGIAPPGQRAGDVAVVDVSALRRRPLPQPTVVCPHCGSERTQVVSPFGSTPCKALYRCSECLEPFDYFKCH